MNFYLVSDWHLNHNNLKTYCQRPEGFTELIVKRHNETVKPTDAVINLGDVAIGRPKEATELIRSMNGRKFLVRGNHDRKHSCAWWMEHGFDFACDGMKFRNCWLTHVPSTSLADGCELNVHGHLHNIWHGFAPDGGEHITRLHKPWQRLFALEYTDYRPVEFEKFICHPDKYQARGPKNEL
jgi:calcineurin-like phosphoesterase family protein